MSGQRRSPGGTGRGKTTPAEWNRLLRRLRLDCKPETIAGAADAVGALGPPAGEDPKVVRALVRVLGHEDEGVRQRVTIALKKLRCFEEVVPLLVENAAGTDEDAACAASATLAALGSRAISHPSVAELIDDWSSRADRRSRRCALHLLRGLSPRARYAGVTAKLIDLLWAGDWDDRLGALEVLGSRATGLLADDAGLGRVREGMRDERDAVRHGAVEALLAGIEDHGAGLLPAMLEGLRREIEEGGDPHEAWSREVDLRQRLAQAIVDCTDRATSSEPFLGALEQGLKSGDPELRRWCADVLHRLPGESLSRPEVSLLVVDALLNWDPEVRRIAACTLPSDPSAISATREVRDRLVAVTQHGTDDVRWLAGETLRKLG